jgi:hypothetical protein
MVRFGDVGDTVATVPNFQLAAVPPAGAAVFIDPLNVVNVGSIRRAFVLSEASEESDVKTNDPCVLASAP